MRSLSNSHRVGVQGGAPWNGRCPWAGQSVRKGACRTRERAVMVRGAHQPGKLLLMAGTRVPETRPHRSPLGAAALFPAAGNTRVSSDTAEGRGAGGGKTLYVPGLEQIKNIKKRKRKEKSAPAALFLCLTRAVSAPTC